MRYTEKDIEWVKDNLFILGYGECAKHFNTSTRNIREAVLYWRKVKGIEIKKPPIVRELKPKGTPGVKRTKKEIGSIVSYTCRGRTYKRMVTEQGYKHIRVTKQERAPRKAGRSSEKYRFYTEEEIQYVRDNIQTLGINHLAEHFGVSRTNIRKRIDYWRKIGKDIPYITKKYKIGEKSERCNGTWEKTEKGWKYVKGDKRKGKYEVGEISGDWIKTETGWKWNKKGYNNCGKHKKETPLAKSFLTSHGLYKQTKEGNYKRVDTPTKKQELTKIPVIIKPEDTTGKQWVRIDKRTLVLRKIK